MSSPVQRHHAARDLFHGAHLPTEICLPFAEVAGDALRESLRLLRIKALAERCSRALQFFLAQTEQFRKSARRGIVLTFARALDQALLDEGEIVRAPEMLCQ